jgi:hypothetical protein
LVGSTQPRWIRFNGNTIDNDFLFVVSDYATYSLLSTPHSDQLREKKVTTSYKTKKRIESFSVPFVVVVQSIS